MERLKSFVAGLNGKILVVAVVPIFLLGIFTAVSEQGILSEITASQETVTTISENADNVTAVVAKMRNNMSSAIRLAGQIVRNHQNTLITRNAGQVAQTQALRNNLRGELGNLTASTNELYALLLRLNYVTDDASQALSEVADTQLDLEARKAFYQTLRLGRSMERRFELFEGANGRTIDLIQSGDFATANSNFRFEETARLNAFDNSLSNMGVTLAKVENYISDQSSQSRAAAQEQSHDVVVSAINTNLIIVVIGIIVIIAAASFFTQAIIVKPMHAQVGAMNELADGKIDVDIPHASDTDLAQIAAALQQFKNGLVEKERLETEQEEARKEAEERRIAEEKAERERLKAEQEQERAEAEKTRKKAEHIQGLIGAFDTRVANVLKAVGDASVELESSATTMRQVAADSETKSTEVASAAQQASNNVQSVAAASEEMAASVQEITRQVAQSSTMTQQATEQARSTNTTVQDLAGNVSKIDDIVQLINDIAEQTNLLALNATIEAARAGDAGKGFAVVASEVKALANQTGKATDEIRTQISMVQGMSNDASSGMREMLSVFEQTTEIAGSIAAAVEEQNASTLEISNAAGEAANGTDTVSHNIETLREGTKDARSASEQVFDASSVLSQQSDDLRSVVEAFLQDMEKAQAS